MIRRLKPLPAALLLLLLAVLGEFDLGEEAK